MIDIKELIEMEELLQNLAELLQEIREIEEDN